MRTVKTLIASVGLVFVASSAFAQAGPFDHYKCYKFKDSIKFGAQVDLDAFQTQFNLDPKCTVKGQGKLFCVPVRKTVELLAYPAGSPHGPISMPGQDLLEDRICYKVKCKTVLPVKPIVPPEEIQDQFGKRIGSKFKTQYLCTNAIKTSSITTTTVPPTTTTSTTTTTMPQACQNSMAPQCFGPCPTPGDVCVDVAGICDCVPQQQGCDFDPATQQCGGICPNVNDVCTLFAGGVCDCVPSQPAGCGPDPLTQQCVGTCPDPTLICAQFPGADCHCTQPCDVDAGGTCGGGCINPGEICVADPVAGCRCG